ncbi:hypothetical protein [Carboxylicivirga caseinilyticus]|uniref:hypothetical protein n=1 Tax=Carboxylicivirga caseinilyticus TaxID=3417572 RepID=UPI003D33766D|nr:hypothetical protein [Marinilabiliaceae bacterium A049]
MKKIIILIAIITLWSCSKSDDQTASDDQFNLYSAIEFSLYNANHEDLLDNTTTNHYKESEIKLFYVIDRQTEEVYNTNSTYPRGIMIYKHENEYRIRIGLNHTETDDKPITYVQWNKSDIDTIEVSYKRTQYSIIQNNIWLNGEHIWELGDNIIDPYFVLTK